MLGRNVRRRHAQIRISKPGRHRQNDRCCCSSSKRVLWGKKRTAQALLIIITVKMPSDHSVFPKVFQDQSISGANTKASTFLLLSETSILKTVSSNLMLTSQTVFSEDDATGLILLSRYVETNEIGRGSSNSVSTTAITTLVRRIHLIIPQQQKSPSAVPFHMSCSCWIPVGAIPAYSLWKCHSLCLYSCAKHRYVVWQAKHEAFLEGEMFLFGS